MPSHDVNFCCIQWVKNFYPPRFSEIFSQRLRILSKILHPYCIFISTANFIQLSLNLSKLCHIKRNNRVNFHFSLEGQPYRLHCKGRMATKFTRLQPTWLSCVGFQKLRKTITELKSVLQHIWDDLPQTTINKAINNFHKRLNARTSAGGGHFKLYTEIFWLNSVCCFRNCNKLCILTRCLSRNSSSC